MSHSMSYLLSLYIPMFCASNVLDTDQVCFLIHAGTELDYISRLSLQ
jgi:hypothetical protein